jgi:hypothetical protein
MVKTVLGVVGSFVAMMVFFFALFTALYLMLGAERVFEPGTFQISTLWIALALGGSLVAGILAGFLCLVITGSFRACQVLAVIVFVTALAMCFSSMTADQTPRPRAGDLPAMEAMQQGQAPVWMHLLSAVLEGAGVLTGARMKRKSLAG